MGLLRNARGLLIPDAFGGKPGRADDPEFHIRRLHHFGQGMGVDLTSTHPNFSRKHIARSPLSAMPTDLFQVDSHDEGLHLPQGHISAGSDAIQLEMGSEHPQFDKAITEFCELPIFKAFVDTLLIIVELNVAAPVDVNIKAPFETETPSLAVLSIKGIFAVLATFLALIATCVPNLTPPLEAAVVPTTK